MSDRGALPTFIIIGAMKCGTSSLHYYLSQHPEISMSMPKELNYFLSSIEDGRDLQIAGRNFEKGVEWYKSHFDPSCPARGESSPAYMDSRHRDVASRIFELVPDAQLIVLTRNPFDRAVSEYHHRIASGDETRPLNEAVLDSESTYVSQSKYHSSLEPFYELFGPGQIVRYRQEDLDTHTREVVESVVERLGVDTSFVIEGVGKRLNTAAGRGVLHHILQMGQGTQVRRVVARALPSSWKYALDARSRQARKASQPTINEDPYAELRKRFSELIGDDEQLLLADITSGRLVEGFQSSTPSL